MKKSLVILLSLLIVSLLAGTALAEGSEISYGKSYTLITPASAAYPDNSAKLTDGIFGTLPDGSTSYYSSDAYVGFNQVDADENGNFVIILDLGKKYTDISAVTVGFLNETDVGIYAPKSVSFALADDRNGAYTELGILNTAKSTDSGISETHAMTLAADDAEGRYLRVTIAHLGKFTDKDGNEKSSGWTFIDEISVYSSGNAEGGTGSLPEQSKPSPAESSEITESETSAPPSESSTPEIPDAGDGGIFVFVLLAISSVAMIGALFTGRAIKNRL
jgi:hypothetical protein